MLVTQLSEGDRKKLTFLGLVAIVFLGFVVYSNILHAPFVFDDYTSILDSENVKNVKTALGNLSNKRYVVELSFALNYAVGAIRPLGYHLVNNLIHVTNALFVYWFVLLTFQTPAMGNSKLSRKFIAFASAFVFVSHPIQTQAVTYVAQRYTSMAVFFYLLSIIMYVKSSLMTIEKTEKNSRRYYAKFFALYGLSFISAVFAMKSKEIALTFPLMILLYEFCFFRESQYYKTGRQRLKRFLYLLPLLLTILIIPLSTMDFARPVETFVENIDAQTRDTLKISRADYLLTEFRVIVTYLRLLVFPVKQSIDYTYPFYHSFLQPQVFLSFLLLLTIFFLGIYLFYRSFSSSPGLRLIAFGIFWFFMTLSVESTLIPIKDVIFEHRLYLPSVGFFIAAITSLEQIIRQPKTKVGVIFIMVLILSVSAYKRNEIWKDPQILWEDVLDKFPNNVRAYNALGVIYKNDSQYEKAVGQFQKILTINSEYPPAYYNLGDIRLKLGDYEGAITYFKKTLTLKLSYHFHIETLNSLAIAYSEKGDNENAVATFRKAIKGFPGEISPYNNLGRQYIKMGEADKAIDILEKALQIRKASHLYYNLSQAYKLKGEKLKSLEAYQTAMELKGSGR